MPPTNSSHSGLSLFDRFAQQVTRWTGSTRAFILAFVTILVWGMSGPMFHFSDTWQLVINTGTTIITFLMVFIIQRTQNKDTLAMQLKLNEILASMKGASNRLVNVESVSDAELQKLREQYEKLSQYVASQTTDTGSCSIEDVA